MKKGICLGSIPGKDVMEKFQLAKDAGFDGVEIKMCETDEQLEEAKKAAQATGLEIPSIMGGIQWQFPLSSPDPEVRRKGIDGMKRAIEQAAAVGANTVLLVPGVVNEETSYEEAFERSTASTKELVPLAEEKKVYVGVENVWNKFLLSPTDMIKFIDGIGSEYVQAYFDAGNILIYGYPQQWIRSLGKRIKKVHVKDFILNTKSFTYLLQGNVPWKEVMAALREVGYDDYITAELPPYPQCPEQMVYDTSAALDKIFAM